MENFKVKTEPEINVTQEDVDDIVRQEQANRNRTLQIYHRCDKNAA